MVLANHKHRFPYESMRCQCGLELKDYTYDDILFSETKGSKRCKKYSGVGIDSFPTPRWNQGLGQHTSSIRETEKIARRKGLEPIGDCPLEKVFKPKTEQTSREIAQEMMREYRKEHRRVVV